MSLRVDDADRVGNASCYAAADLALAQMADPRQCCDDGVALRDPVVVLKVLKRLVV